MGSVSTGTSTVWEEFVCTDRPAGSLEPAQPGPHAREGGGGEGPLMPLTLESVPRVLSLQACVSFPVKTAFGVDFFSASPHVRRQ